MITRQAIHGEIERCGEFAKSFIGLGRIVLNEISGCRNQVSRPCRIAEVSQYFSQGSECHCATETAVGLSEQVWVCYV